ncbi:AAA family ATPase [Limnohabitans sp. 2KL-17]|uniref:AAA family ATPase n=1 Tax=Limnohabitans sp. 2KL-17 TaxID=1100704 RepID=UPI000D3AC01D|nr:AAA family ATPase [Limnohabitans sp. 2KL-17]PUE56932.1 AAA family ATPase [Limnohabitans sp. 2KL-17]
MAAKVQVKSLTFGKPPFRKLGNINIEFADRLTLIAGHNGIGKSTILGLVANTFGITERGGPKSYFGEPFSANIERIVYLALAEVDETQKDLASAPVVTAYVNGTEVKKRCSMTRRSVWKRARVVPRTIDKAEDDTVGQDAKIPLPTIYLGMRRLASAGEADEKEVTSSQLDMHPADSNLMVAFVSSVIHGTELNTDVTHQTIKGSKKKTAQPGYTQHDALAVSMGQDSLGSMATALASFNQLKREMGDAYPGGLLVIDEMDVGFHPHAIERLAKSLKTYAKQLDLQIIATTHSPRLIEAVHPDGDGNANAPDKVIYLLDTKFPRLAEDQSLRAMLDDMALKPEEEKPKRKAKPTLAVYFEDDEAAQFCDRLIPTAKKSALSKKYGVRINWIPLGIGGSHLVKLPEKDPLFLDRVLIVDADTTVPQAAAARGNIVKLPNVPGTTGVARSLENTTKQFLRDISNTADGPLHQALLNLNTQNPTSDKVHRNFFQDGDGESTERNKTKAWWKRHWSKLKNWGVIEQWAEVYKAEAEKFETAFEAAVARTAGRLKDKA